MRVLVVDDEAGIRQLIRNIIQMKGDEVLEAEDGLEALELARRLPCDLVITDQVMPGMNGLDLIACLSAERYRARFLLISGFGVEDRETGGVPFLAKPFTVTQLLGILDKLAGQPDLPVLERAWLEAKAEWRQSIQELNQIVADVPSGIPHPDGTLRIQRAGLKRKAAYEKYRAAYRTYREAVKLGGLP
jgi:YesN/AraC family two-component response regulator